MNEKIPNPFEKGREFVPTPEEVRSIFEQLVGEKEYKEVRKLEDEHGLYLWEIRVFEENGFTEYLYTRKGQHDKGSAGETVINVVFLNRENIPCGGHSVANFINGRWELTP